MFTTTTHLSDLVLNNPNTAAVLERHGLDFCCAGKRSLAVACEAKGLDPEQVLNELREASDSLDTFDTVDRTNPADLISHIVSVHHDFVRRALPVIVAHTEKIAEVHGPKHPELAEVAEIFAEVQAEMDTHMFKEEKILFPFIVGMWEAKTAGGDLPHACFGTVRSPIEMMEAEHDSAGGAMARIRELTSDFTVPEGACTTYQLTLKELRDFEEDLHRHVHKENYILHPLAIALEQELMEAPVTL